MFAIGKVPLATRCYGKQNIQCQNKIDWHNVEVSKVKRNTLWCLTFPRSRQQTSRYKLQLSHFFVADELAPSF